MVAGGDHDTALRPQPCTPPSRRQVARSRDENGIDLAIVERPIAAVKAEHLDLPRDLTERVSGFGEDGPNTRTRHHQPDTDGADVRILVPNPGLHGIHR